MLEPGDAAASYLAHILPVTVTDCGHQPGHRSVPQTPLLLAPCTVFAAFQVAPTALALENLANKLFAYDMAHRAENCMVGESALQRGMVRAPVEEVHQALGRNCSPYKDFSRAIVHNTQLGMILGFDCYAATHHVARDKLLNHSHNSKSNGYSYGYLVVVQTLTSPQ